MSFPPELRAGTISSTTLCHLVPPQDGASISQKNGTNARHTILGRREHHGNIGLTSSLSSLDPLLKAAAPALGLLGTPFPTGAKRQVAFLAKNWTSLPIAKVRPNDTGPRAPLPPPCSRQEAPGHAIKKPSPSSCFILSNSELGRLG